MTKIKICGMTCKEDIKAAIDLKIDYLGFILYSKSPRFVSRNEAKNLTSIVPRNIKKVAVLVNETEDNIQKIIDLNIFDVLQFHGKESPEFCKKFNDQIIFKAFHIKDKEDIKKLKEYDVYGYLLDTYTKNLWGGTGVSFDWEIARNAAKIKKPIILSGGLNIDNILDALRIVQPDIVDVCSGVEYAPGKKDKSKMKEFVSKARSSAL